MIYTLRTVPYTWNNLRVRSPTYGCGRTAEIMTVVVVAVAAAAVVVTIAIGKF